jgi:phage terminase large subunit GpA-like protein
MTAPTPNLVFDLLAKQLRPRKRITVSQWADAHRRLSGKASAEPGQWRTSRNPALRAIMDDLGEEHRHEHVVVMKSSQVGVSEGGLNWLGYIMDYVTGGKPAAVVMPTDDDIKDYVKQRVRPMIQESPRLATLIDAEKARDGSNSMTLMDYPGGVLYLLSARSAAALKSKPIRFFLFEEPDEWPDSTQGRGDPASMTRSRQSTFARRKTLEQGTPTIKGASRIESAYAETDQREYHVPCPHCGELQVLKWEQIGWSQHAAEVWYTCVHNGCKIDERDKPRMLAERSADHPDGARWIPRNPEASRRGYHISALYAPIGLGYSWTQLVQEYLAAVDDDEKLQVFVNERLGLPWEDKRTAVRADSLQDQAEPYELRTLPPGALLLTAGVDTQDDRLEVQIVAWGEHKRWWIVDYARLYGSPGQPDVWLSLIDHLRRPIASHRGQAVPLQAVAIDMGGHHTDDVKRFAISAPVRRCMAIIGSRHRLDRVLGRKRLAEVNVLDKPDPVGMHYYPVGTELAKDRLFDDLRHDARVEDRAERLGHLPDSLPPEYFEGLVSEIWNARRQRYEPKRGMTRRNEPLDTWVYAYAAAHHPEVRLDTMRPIDWKRLRERFEPEETPQPAIPAPAPEPPPPSQDQDATTTRGRAELRRRNRTDDQRQPRRPRARPAQRRRMIR